MLSKVCLLNALDRLVYFTLVFVGIFFIYQGEVVPKFSWKRTNFAERLGGTISELPTIVTYLYPFEKLKLGEDFNISFSILKDEYYKLWNTRSVILFEGNNTIDEETQFSVDFERLDTHAGSVFRISHVRSGY